MHDLRALGIHYHDADGIPANGPVDDVVAVAVRRKQPFVPVPELISRVRELSALSRLGKVQGAGKRAASRIHDMELILAYRIEIDALRMEG